MQAGARWVETPDEAATAQEVLATIDPGVETGKGPRLTMQASGRDSLMTSLEALTARGISPTEVSLRKPSLDEVFLSLTEDDSLTDDGSRVDHGGREPRPEEVSR